MKSIRCALLLALISAPSLSAAGGALCGAAVSPDPFFFLTVHAHKEHIISTADIQSAVTAAVPADPAASLLEAYNTTAVKEAYRNLIKQDQVARQWPETVHKLKIYLAEQTGEEEKVAGARELTRRVLAPHEVQQLDCDGHKPAFIRDDNGHLLIAHLAGDGKVQVHALGGSEILFETIVPDISATSSLTWHRRKNGKISLHLAWKFRPKNPYAKQRSKVGVREWDWASRKQKPKDQVIDSTEDVRDLHWASVPRESLLLEVDAGIDTITVEVGERSLKDIKVLSTSSKQTPPLPPLYVLPSEFRFVDGLAFKSVELEKVQSENLSRVIQVTGAGNYLHTRDGKIFTLTKPNSDSAFMQFTLANGRSFDRGKRLELDAGTHGNPELFETADGRILAAIITLPQFDRPLRVQIFEPLKSQAAIHTEVIEPALVNGRLHWFNDAYQQPLLGILGQEGKSEVFAPLMKISLLKFNSPKDASWFEDGGNIYFRYQVGSKMKIVEMFSDGTGAP